MELNIQLESFLAELLLAFPGQVAFCGLQGSCGRGEATAESDVDLVVILEEVDREILERYRALIAAMPFAGRACGFVCARRMLARWPAFDALQLLLDTRPLYGDLAGLLPPMSAGDIAQAAAVGCANLYHAACHACLFDADPAAALPALKKAAFFALRMEYYRRTGRYVARKRDLLPLLEPEERALLAPAGDPGAAYEGLIRWAGEHMAPV